MSVYKTANLNRNNKNTFLKHILSSQFSTHQLKRYVIISHRKRKYNFLKQNQIDPPLPVPPLSCCGTFLKNSFSAGPAEEGNPRFYIPALEPGGNILTSNSNASVRLRDCQIVVHVT